MKQVSLHSLAFTLLSLLTIPSFGQATETLSPSSDVTLRSDQADKSFSALPTLELYTALNEDETVKSDFIGLMSFNVPIKEGYVGFTK